MLKPPITTRLYKLKVCIKNTKLQLTCRRALTQAPAAHTQQEHAYQAPRLSLKCPYDMSALIQQAGQHACLVCKSSAGGRLILWWPQTLQHIHCFQLQSHLQLKALVLPMSGCTIS